MVICNYITESFEFYDLREQADIAFLKTFKSLEMEDNNVLEGFTYASYYANIYGPNCLKVDHYRRLLKMITEA